MPRIARGLPGRPKNSGQPASRKQQSTRSIANADDLLQVLSSSATSDEDISEPARKRRRLDVESSQEQKQEELNDQPVSNVFWNLQPQRGAPVDYILLAELTLPLVREDLYVPVLSPSKKPSVDAKAEAVSVSILKVDNYEHGEVKLELLLVDRPVDQFLVTAKVNNTTDIRNRLEDAVQLHRRRRIPSKHHDDAAWVESCLKWHEKLLDSTEIEVKIFYKTNVARADARGGYASADTSLLSRYLGLAQCEKRRKWTPHEFYQNLYVPESSDATPSIINEVPLESKLFAFQKRAVEWLLRREGKTFSGANNAFGKSASSTPPEPSFVERKDREGETCYASNILGKVVKDPGSIPRSASSLRGGILAEEMGLGKTVELIALMLLNPRPPEEKKGSVYDAYSGSDVMPSSSTLIITPSGILHQWQNELQEHAPQLRVMHYAGISEYRLETSAQPLYEELFQHDVVLTTYDVLSREIHYANAEPDRSLRHAKRYERRRSPLVQILWWRVCLDEAQMIESGVSAAAVVAQQIPRVNAWAVSGTPLRKDIQDLLGLLIFLRYDPYSHSKKLWTRLVQDDSDTLRDVFKEIALRHTKEMVRDDLRLPPQKRAVITMQFSAIEEQNYSHLFQQMCDDVGVSQDGAPLSGLWDPESPSIVEKMRTWLIRLRQTCLHPQVGTRNRRALGRNQGPLRTVGEVLELMIDQNESAVNSEEQYFILAKIHRGHVLGNNKSEIRRSVDALSIYQEALSQASRMVEECRRQLMDEKERLAESSDKPLLDVTSATEDAETGAEDKDTEQRGRLNQYRKSLRSALSVLHICTFFTATAFYQIKSNEDLTEPGSKEFHTLEKQETDLYDQAKKIRKEILREANTKAEKLMRTLHRSKKLGSLTKLAKLHNVESTGGIENRKIKPKLDNIVDLLDRQSSQLEEWRVKIVELLLQPLVDEEQGLDTTGEEYEDSTKQQDELYVYIESLRAIVADRFTTLSGQTNTLIEYEMKQYVRQAKNDLELPDDIPREERTAHAPELLLKNMDVRNTLKPTDEVGSLRGLLHELRSMATALEWQEGQGSARAGAELEIVKAQLAKIQDTLNAQLKTTTGLETELSLFRSTMNQRLEFYRQLQQESDRVKPYKEELDEILDVQALDRATNREKGLSDKVDSLKTKRRFLLHLRAQQDQQDEQRFCVICQSTFEQGVLTVCGHQYCKDCIRLWWNQHRSCPTCKRHLSLRDFHQITYKPQEIKAKEESSSITPQHESSLSQSTALYSEISASTMNEIKSIDIDGSFGTKIDTLARHILWIRDHDPGSKSIIFSQYRDFLGVLGRAFTQFKIGFASISSRHGVDRFRSDPSTEVFLLDAKSDSSGLNLVNATHVFLCEPLVNAAIELQAIARVHRIGQQRPTTVYMYLISDTVEEAIYDISVTRRLAHISSSMDAPSKSQTTTNDLQESAIDAANSLEMERAPISKMLVQGKGSGELVEQGDLWACLFGRSTKSKHTVTDELEGEVGRHLRAEAAERRADGVEPAPAVA
ncbi:MAG: hypothetical protein M1820_000444 [Bogoriella megaspora]|nr:MAG: hypothetical protein M1820_000444 [Bogoriella megaspora]